MVNTVSWKYRNDTWPLTTSYTSFSAYSIEDAWRQTYESQEQVDVMMVEWQKQTITKWSSTISEKYMAWWEWFDMWSSYWGGEVLVVFQTNANADLLAYVIKSRDELWDDWNTYRYAFMWMMTDAIWNTMQWWFSTTLTVTTSSWTITISDGSQSILVNASNHNMRYNVDYYDWTSNTATEYATLQTNWWLQDWTYTYQWANQDWNDIVDSLKAKGIVNATIAHDTVAGEITMANGQWSMTIMDKNLWASNVRNRGDTLSEANCWYVFQRWNSYGFSWNWEITKVISSQSTRIDSSNYWPWNNYLSSNFMITWTGWGIVYIRPINEDMWWDVTDTDFARQWPCPSWYHIPSKNEFGYFINAYKALFPNRTVASFRDSFCIPLAWTRSFSNWNSQYSWVYWEYLTSTIWDANNQYPYYLRIEKDDALNPRWRSTAATAAWLSIRPFKNTVTS